MGSLSFTNKIATKKAHKRNVASNGKQVVEKRAIFNSPLCDTATKKVTSKFQIALLSFSVSRVKLLCLSL